MKQMEHSYKGEEKFLVIDLKTIVSKAKNNAFAAVNYSLVERNWRLGKRIVEESRTEQRELSTESISLRWHLLHLLRNLGKVFLKQT